MTIEQSIEQAIAQHGAAKVYAAAHQHMAGNRAHLSEMGLEVKTMGDVWWIMSAAFKQMSPLEKAQDNWDAQKELRKAPERSASAVAKAAGLKSLKEAADMVGKPANTLQNWFNDEPTLFHAVILGCAQIKRQRE